MTNVVPEAVATQLSPRLEQLRALRGPAVVDLSLRVHDVVVVVSSSRGGSSMLAELLRRSPSLLHLTAEINPFLRLAGLTHPASGTGSDHLGAEHAPAGGSPIRRLLDDELARDTGSPSDLADDERFALDLTWRIAVQWPRIDLDPVGCALRVVAIVGALRRRRGWGPAEIRDVPEVLLALLRQLRDEGHDVNPWYYDIPADLLAGEAPDQWPAGALGPLLLEEPPFVLPRVWRRADDEDVATKPLVIKTPSNAYRLPFLGALFPNARVRVVHLTRNPAAALNGLVDGWHHTGFHSHRMEEPLRITGYGDDCPADRWWWKFDLPPGWPAYVDAPLLDVCAFQWRAAHLAVLEEVARTRPDHMRIQFEDLVQGPERRVACLEQLSEWLGIPFDAEYREAASVGIEPIMTTVPPSPERWRRREGDVRAAIAGDTRAVAEALGYGDEARWI